MFTIRWFSYALKKRGEKVKWQCRKRVKTVNNLVLCDNNYNILAISDCIEGHHHDSYELIDNVQQMVDSLDQQAIDYHLSHLNADSGFDVKAFMTFIEKNNMTPNIR